MSQKIIIMFNYTHLRKKLNYSVFTKKIRLFKGNIHFVYGTGLHKF